MLRQARVDVRHVTLRHESVERAPIVRHGIRPPDSHVVPRRQVAHGLAPLRSHHRLLVLHVDAVERAAVRPSQPPVETGDLVGFRDVNAELVLFLGCVRHGDEEEFGKVLDRVVHLVVLGDVRRRAGRRNVVVVGYFLLVIIQPRQFERTFVDGQERGRLRHGIVDLCQVQPQVGVGTRVHQLMTQSKHVTGIQSIVSSQSGRSTYVRR
mmetsp:Transcript_28998/g.53030  ORF Transcript_28998/g.53030 Transcript_28998/m.53030 type:complete len:209 (-) Transcript_28998:2252-2878(-)